MKKRILATFLCGVFAVSTLVGCGNNSTKEETVKKEAEETIKNATEQKKKLVVGTDAYQRPAVDAVEEALAELGYELEVKVFDDSVMPNTATMEGTVDATMYQHTPFMEKFNESNNASLYMMQPVLFYTTVGLYSEKYDSVEELPEKAKIVVGNDASNIDRALRMLDSHDLIKLSGEKTDDFYSIHDVVENPKNFELLEVAPRQVVNNMQDIDAAVIYGTTMLQAGKDPSKALCFDDKTRDKAYALGVVVLEENKDQPWAQDLVEAFMSDVTWEKVNAYFKGSYAQAYND